MYEELNTRRHTKRRQSGIVKVGDIVLISNDKANRLHRPLTKVAEIFPGKDGVTRLIRLKISQGYLFRPIPRLHP
ncbi:unnamed protein product [Larinioides sclopetarius]|uniref:DUF5641 domain-containing protein n=1 Tax=Larinioides sclopetarius TaxID=280406 RepID=A0AAV1ZBY7_9ARAC